MNNISIDDLQTTELEELNLFADSENGLRDLSDVELDNVQGEGWGWVAAGVVAGAAAGYLVARYLAK